MKRASASLHVRPITHRVGPVPPRRASYYYRSQMRRRLLINGTLVLLAVGAAACGDVATEPPAGGPAAGPRGDAPRSPELRRLERQASRILDGGPAAFQRRLGSLRGHPVVVNQWASWCSSCRYEFPFFQRLASKYRGRVAFLGVDSQDSRPAAENFLREFPTPFPHDFDPETRVARLFGGGRAWPSTAYYNADGKRTKTHVGAFATQAKLDEDVRRYALGG